MPDPRRRVPRTDVLLAHPRLAEAERVLGRAMVKAAVVAAQGRARAGEIEPEQVAEHAIAALPATATTLRPVVNATGVIVHTNLGRAPLSRAALDAVVTAGRSTDVEFDLATGRRARRGRGALAALADAVPAAGGVHVVNNNAGHERFVPNMLAGVGPVPAVMFVVAADEGWMPQSAEHLAALDALGVRHALVVVTKADLADPGQAAEEALSHLAVLGRPEVVPVGRGWDLDPLRRALCRLTDGLPAPDPAADVRLWVDRAFTVRGAGTVVTGTLAGGTLRAGDELELAGERVSVRALQSLGADETDVTAVARVAVNLRGVDRDRVRRGDALLTPGAWVHTSEVDVAVRAERERHRELVLHIGAAAVPAHVRPLGTEAARLRLRTPLPLRIGDTGLLRDPGEHRIAAGIDVPDVGPPALTRRGSARARAAELATGRVTPPPIARARALRAMGFPLTGKRIGEWVVDENALARGREEALSRFDEWSRRNPVAAGMPVEALRHALDPPSAELVPAALDGTGLEIGDGLVRRPGAALPPRVLSALAWLDEHFREHPFRAPEADDLAELRLGSRELAAAVRAGRLIRLADGVFLGPDATARAAERLAALRPPFTVSEARRALDTTRRVAVPLLELLDQRRMTVQGPDSRRRLR